MTCNICKETDSFLFYPYNKYRCKECIKKISKEYKKQNKDKKKETDAEYYKLNKESFESYNKIFKEKNPNYAKNYRIKNKKKIALRLQIYWEKQIHDVSDVYLRSSGLCVSNKNIIEVKRELIKIKREIKKQTL